MPESAPSVPTFYNSSYRNTVDEKRRVQIPAKWRAGETEEFVLIRWPNGVHKEACLLALPITEWMGLVQKLKAMPYSDPKADSLRRLLGRKSDRVSTDKSGRVCLPEDMAKATEIEREAVLVGLVDRFEIWNPKRYEEVTAVDEALSSEAFKLI